jgi:lipoprotein-releasing system ATP-binding protein
MQPTTILRAHHITKTFTQGGITLEVLRGVSASFEQGNTYAITGVSGAGKSTLLHILAGLDTPTTGSVTFNGRDITTFSKSERAQWLNKHIGLVFQQPYLINELSVLENVITKGLIAGMPKAECYAKAAALLDKVGLSAKAECMPATLSGGQQTRVALARALLNEPTFLFADEPTGNLDEETAQGIVEVLLACQREWGMGVVVSSHDEYVVQRMGTVMQLSNGVLV